MNRRTLLFTIDKLSMDGEHPSSIVLNLLDGIHPIREEGFDVVVVDLRPEEKAGQVLVDAGIPVRYLGKGIFSPSILPALMRVVRQENADLLHCHGYNAANFGRLAGYLTGKPVVIHEHAVLAVKPHQFLADKLLSRLTTCGVAISEAVREFMIRGRSVPEDRITIVHNGIQLDRYRRRPEPDIRAGREKLGIDPGALVIGTLTRLREEKGNRTLIAAMPAILARHPGAMLVIGGDGPERAALEQQVRELGIANRVLFAGFVKAGADLLTLFDLMAIPSLSEGLSYAGAEAMACGVPVVASDVGGLPELLDRGTCGVLVPPGDAGALAAAIADLLSDPARIETLRAAGLKRAEAFSIETYAKHLCSVYRRALAS
ncbi:MAG: glycosyltransferase family 4 protein [Verrucomicrobia bacterium]|nr:glycosyltransferase family 4 protein [Kiritimatiellia bacterium]MCB1100868.1 glycosyltransferase family 4 protein [Kiritimatiellia bacterium]MCP5489396.1 glycosyltransferase family 4 protein [Verrucomicrobiota bacterium]